MPKPQVIEHTVKNPTSEDVIIFKALESDVYSFFINDILSVSDEDIKKINSINKNERYENW